MFFIALLHDAHIWPGSFYVANYVSARELATVDKK